MTSPATDSSPRKPIPKRLLAIYVVSAFALAVVATFIWLMLREYRESAHTDRCRANLKRIATALQAYHDIHSSFPPAYVVDSNGNRLHSWRVLLLPFLGQEDLYAEYRFDEPWNGQHNRVLATKMPDFFACSSGAGRANGVTNFLAVVGRATAWPEHYAARLEDFSDGTSNTIQIVESGDSDVLWLEPRDITHHQAIKRDQPVNYPTISSTRGHGDTVCVATADGAVRMLRRETLGQEVFRSLLTANGGRWMPNKDWPPEPNPAGVLPLPRPAEELTATDVLPCPTSDIVAGRNYVYCATFELAWSDARRVIGGGILKLDGGPPLADELNRRSFDGRSLSESSYIARAGRGDEKFREMLREEMARKFPGSVPRLLDNDPNPHAILVYAYLLKSVPFAVEFDSLDQPLQFRVGNQLIPVAGFGVLNLNDVNARGHELQSQVKILDYVSDDEFVLELTPVTASDDIVLAKVAPDNTLEETIASVRQRILRPDPRHTEKRLFRSESLAVPKLLASIERRYTEFTPRGVIGTDLYVSVAIQAIRFRLNESGALLESEVAIAADDGLPYTPAGQRKFVFDRPFLIYLIEHDADQPYFAAWIANTELMEPAPGG